MGNVNQTSTRAAARPQAPTPSTPAEEIDLQASAAGTATAEASGKPARGLVGHLADVFIGGGEAIGDMVKGIFTVITHPIQTLKGIGYVITHPASLVHAFVDPYKQAIAEGRPGKALGRGIVEIGSLFITPSQVAGAFKGAKGFLTGSKGVAEAGQVTAKAGALGAKGAELSSKLGGQAAAALEKAGALKAVGHVGEAAKLEQFARIMQKSATIAAQGTDDAVTRAVRYATMAANAQNVKVVTAAGTQVMTMANLVDHSNTLLSAAAKASGKVAEGVAKSAAKGAAEVAEGAAKAVVSTQPVLTKTAIRELATAGIKDAKVIRAALDDAAKVFNTQRAAGATSTAAKEAARVAAAAKLGLEPTATAIEKLVNGVRLQGAVANPANYFTRTRYVRPGLHQAAEIIGKPIDVGIVAGRELAKDASLAASKAGQKVANAVSRIGELQIRQIPHAIGTVATWPFRVTYNALSGAGQVLRNGLSHLGDLPLRRIWEVPAEGVVRAIQAGSQVIGRIPDLTLGQIASAPFAALAHPAGLLRPAVALSVLGRLNGTKDMPADDSEVADKYGILATPENLKAFKAEVASYQEGAIGPDAGEPAQVAQLQTILRKLGYDVEPSGTFDEATALAVIDFKQKHGITQGYQLADGKPAINEYVDEATAQAMVAALKGEAGAAGEAGNLPSVSAEEVQASLDTLGKGFDALRGAKTESDKKKARTALEASAVAAIGDLIAYASANPDAKEAAQTQLQEIGKAFQEAGYTDEQIQALMDEARNNLVKQMEATAQTKPSDETKPASEVPQVTGKQIQASLDALDKGFGTLRGAKTEADKQKAKAALEPIVKQAIHDLTAYGLANEEARPDVEDQLNEIAAALKEAGYSDDAITALIDAAQEPLLAAPPAGAEGKPSQPATRVGSYEAHVGAIAETLDKLKAAKTTSERAQAQQELLEHFRGAVEDFNALISEVPADQLAAFQNQLTQLGTALTQLGFSRTEIANILKSATAKPAPATASTQPAPATSSGKPAPATASTPPAQGTATEGKPYVVKNGDTLSRIAQAELGDPNRWREIYELNKQLIGMNPNLILPGQKIQLPGAKPAQPAQPVPAKPPVQGEQPTISDEQLAALVKEKGLLSETGNIQAFVDEVTSYREQGAIGPDSGSPAVVKQLQTLLARLGYQVSGSGAFDDATADAVVDFKVKHGLHQSYKLADGTFAVNEYVGEATATALVAELKKRGKETVAQ